ncbi:MAG TPA: prephenate dehydrogenase/arogenate dehydrogenase family protein [Candidatus Saccharimonadales bacterium]|nr:prephenate dehydrogenase/arogenate dehydrogenase family protein [Candidatus Saccharimonadales bacterium]
MNKKTVTIIGFGRFGKTLLKLIQDDFDVTIYRRHPASSAGSQIKKEKMLNQVQHDKTFTSDLQVAYQSDIIFYAVPIQAFESVISEHKKYLRDDHTLIDVLSVKTFPEKIFRKYLKNLKTQALLTHPLFGPDSSKSGFENLPFVINKFLTNDETYSFWKQYFKKKKLHVVEMTPDEHDRLAANSQGVTHFIGRMLEEFKLEETPIDTIGAKKLQEVKEQTDNDTWELFMNLQHYNPYTKKMRIALGVAYDKLYNKLIPKQANNDNLVIGIQGGKGSFNEEAIMSYLKKNNISNYTIAYLHTSKNVLRALSEGDVDQGLFAMHNSVGGIVMESVEAMAKYKFAIIEEVTVKISHALMIRKDAKLSDITTIMTHPQVLAQCHETLQRKYPNLEKTSGKGELIDHALVAKQLNEGKLPKNVATMGSKILAELYNLTIVEENLQDAKKNDTSFLLVGR